jgi:NCS1 family nucleobase:cation symporter-1
MIVDYWILRKRELDVAELYRPYGKYAGTNGIAVIALILGILPNLPGFLKAAGATSGPPDVWDTIYVYAWFVGLFIAGGVYYVGSKLMGPGKVHVIGGPSRSE